MECGFRLERLPAEDMLDVLHYFFEQDCLGEKEAQEAKLSMRRMIYRDLYDRPYRWQDDSVGDDQWGTTVVANDGKPGNVTSITNAPGHTHKPFIRPTPMNADAAKPFGSVLDAPMG